MNCVKTYFLIDYENVHEDGLSGIEKLETNDHVFLFYTENAAKININILNTLTTSNNKLDLTLHEIPKGNQSLDKHLVSYLGYLIGIHSDKNCQFVIISKDTGFDKIISFWKKQNISCILRRDSISTAKKQKSKSTSNKPKTKRKVPTKKTGEIKCELNRIVQQKISAKYEGKTGNKVASIVVKHFGEDNFANEVHNDLRKSYTNYCELYGIVKPILKRYSSGADTNK